MPSESIDNSNGDRRGMVLQRSFGHPPPPESDPLQCPRCESTNTKFCYYNNYNLRQPRHFCKACRRYWTHGGTLRPVPVGGGTRKRTAKRTRCSSGGSSSSCSPSSSSLTQEVSSAGPVVPGNPISSSAGENSDAAAAAAAANNYLMDLNESINAANGGFSSLLSFQGPPGFLALGGFGYGSGLPHGFDEMGNFGYGGRGVWAFPQGGGDYGSAQNNNNNNNNVGLPGAANGCNNTWQTMNGSEDGLVDFGWPELEISTAAPTTVKEVTELSDKKEGLISHFQEMI